MDRARPGTSIFCKQPGERRCRSKRRTTIPKRRGVFARPRCPIWTTPIRWRAICLRNAADAEDAVQECYLRAFKHFDSYRGPAMKPWLFAILRNVCRAEYARRATTPTGAIEDVPESAEADAALARGAGNAGSADAAAHGIPTPIRRLIAALAEPFRETFVLREIQNLSYREIADVAAVPVGTVMSRLARARAMLRSAWMAEEEQPK